MDNTSVVNFEQLQESDGRQSLLSQDDGFPVAVLARAKARTDRTYEARRVALHGRINDFIENPNFYNQYKLREAMSTDDLPLLFADTMNRQLVEGYTAKVLDWRPYVSIGRFTDLGTKPYYELTAGAKALDPVNELGEYKERSMTEREWSYKIRKYGNRFSFSFETFLRRDVDLWQRSLRALGTGAQRREARNVTSLFVDANGPHASFYDVAGTNKNQLTGNPVFGPAGFEAAFAKLTALTDSDGEPISIGMVHLVLPPQLVPTAELMFGATEWERTMGTGFTYRIANPYRGRVQVHVNPYIPIIASTANGATSWFLFADPGEGLPALEMGFLAGFEQPQLFIKSPDARRVGGGENVFDGSFGNDSLENKIRMFNGGTRLDPKRTLASNGSGT
jgi:hypothetical protein